VTLAAISADLERELHAFLALEAPHLIHRLEPAAALGDLERQLLALVEETYRPHAALAELPLWPGATHADGASWARQAALARVRGFFTRQRVKASIEPAERLEVLRTMHLTRALDEHLKQSFDRKDLKWGAYPSPQKGFRSLGQEAIAGAALRLRRPPAYAPGPDYRGDVLSPLIRDLAALLMFAPDPLPVILTQSGLAGTPMGGRDLHVGDLDWGVLPPAAPLTIATQTAVGMALAFKSRGEDRVCLACIGEGGSSLGEWHESVNLAAVRRLPIVFVLQNNRWALGTSVVEQSAAARFALRADGYGMPGATVFGNDPDEVAAACAWAAERARAGEGPALVELMTYRRSGHAHHDDDRFHGTPTVPGYEIEAERRRWEAADPIALYEERLTALGILDAAAARSMRELAVASVAAAAEVAASAPWPAPDSYRERVYASRRVEAPAPASAPATRRMAYDEAVRQALVEAMEDDPTVLVLGEDVGGRYGGAFGVTRGLAKQFGDGRCLNMPIAESAIVGCGVGAALSGLRPVVEMQFADFLASGFNALVNNAAKVHWRWGRAVPMVVRLPYGGATGTMERLLGGGPYHSQCPEMWFVRTPGWKIVAPSTPRDAKGLLNAALRDENPVLFLEAKGLYGFFRTDLREEVPLGRDFEVPIGQAAVRREGTDLSILTYGAMTWTALAAAEQLAAQGVSAEVVDLRTLVPLDEATIEASVKKTSRALLLHEDTRRGGFGGELAALLSDRLFYFLDAPIRRVAAPDTPVPYSPPLEYDYLPKAEQVVAAALDLVRE
jgi:pyruvate/2-oxoglutarate/acetoin dehydrogenase E1 component/TPP-dependent pyruvate/acetoin dehydrogenase alpha subunit